MAEVTIPLKDYVSLLNDRLFLRCLEKWADHIAYDSAVEEYNKMKREKDRESTED